MAASLTIEHEQGTYFGPIRGKHQGYYAGDFSLRPPQPSSSSLASSRATDARTAG